MTDATLLDNDIRPHLAAIDAAYRAGPVEPDRVPPIAESRELLRLFVRIGNDDLRAALVDLLRTMVAPKTTLTSDAPSDPLPTGASTPGRSRSS